jgi:hypothetical protein
MDRIDVVGRFLIDVVVQPVGEEQGGMSPPCDEWAERRVVVAVVVEGRLDGQSLG